MKASETARERAFMCQGGGSRATYHRYKSELLEWHGDIDPGAVRNIELTPIQPDPHTAAFVERRRQLEELRDALNHGCTDVKVDALPSDSGDENVAAEDTEIRF